VDKRGVVFDLCGFSISLGVALLILCAVLAPTYPLR
jgi:hypothetical protein